MTNTTTPRFDLSTTLDSMEWGGIDPAVLNDRDAPLSRYGGAIRIVKFDPTNSTIVEQLIDCYREVFAVKPWGEYKKCPTCGTTWSLEEKDDLRRKRFLCCGEKVVDFWTRDQVRADIAAEITPDAAAFLAFDQDRLVGFAWGYPTTQDALSQKLALPLSIPVEAQRVAYIDEIGVAAAYRGQGIGSRLLAATLDVLRAEGLSYVLARTKGLPEPSVSYLWLKNKRGFEERAAYPSPDTRVLLGTSLLAPAPKG